VRSKATRRTIRCPQFGANHKTKGTLRASRFVLSFSKPCRF